MKFLPCPECDELRTGGTRKEVECIVNGIRRGRDSHGAVAYMDRGDCKCFIKTHVVNLQADAWLVQLPDVNGSDTGRGSANNYNLVYREEALAVH
ncbi:hypothetical protein AVEN_251795-1 [Araneus ventricosus]|uniref:Uncharacterized protein n=1 Tax=Araneus ventricosus TaxID=182803 RepID=A0A4Y2N3M6_ARAVE|nr:hypothetical protein AVEN_251795-1 [Araneus ventricosus]